MRRRTIITGAFTVTATLVGCLGSPRQTFRGETGTRRTDSTTRASTPGDSPTTVTLNETPFEVAWQWDLAKPAIELGEQPQVALLTSDEWRERIRGSVLNEPTRSLLEATDFATETVVALSARVAAGKNRLVLESVNGVGTGTVQLHVREYESGSGLNNAPLHLLLVRIPNRGTEPTTAEVVLDSVAGTQTVSNGG